MEINRNQYFMLGLVVLMLGIQMRIVDSVVLSEDVSRVLATRFKKGSTAENTALAVALKAPEPLTRPMRRIKPPEWLGWSLISIGSVLILHSLVLKRPG